MKNGTKFAIKKLRNGLYVLELTKNKHELQRFFSFLSNIKFLTEFFEKNIYDLQSEFYNNINKNVPITIEEAVQITTELGDNVTDFYIYLLSLPQDKFEIKINEFFKPLSKEQTIKTLHLHVNQMKKSYGIVGFNKYNWIRIYALKIENTFIITGGAIKLTKEMNQGTQTKIELEKLYKISTQLKKEFITEDVSFEDGLIEF